MAKIKKFLKSKKFWIPFLGVIGMTTFSLGLRKNALSKVSPAQDKTDTVPTIKHPVQSLSFANDTLDSYISALLTYRNNKVVRYLVKNSRAHRMQLPYFVHEWWHHHNKKITYWLKYKYLPSHFMQLKMHEEISANVAAIATADLEYQLADDKEAVIKKYENTYMSFYFDAIKNGTIKPESADPADLDKKYRLLINGSIEMWEQKFRAHYTPSLTFSLKQYLRNYGFHKPTDKNYRKMLSHMYTFGDVDLSKYIERDACFPDIKLDIFNGLGNVRSFNKSSELRETVINHVYAFADKLPYFPVHQRRAVLQHILIAAKVKYELRQLKGLALEPNNKAISCAYDKVCFELSQDGTYAKFIDDCTFLDKARIPFMDEKICFNAFGMSSIIDEKNRTDIAQFYYFQHTDLTKLMKHFGINRLPTDRTLWDDFSAAYVSHPTVEKLILSIPQDTYLFASTHDTSAISDALITEKSSPKDNLSKFGKHLSQNLFVAIPNFEEALLNPSAITPEVRDTLKKLFKAFNDIPAEFRECDVIGSQRYVQTHGNPHYFEYKDAPFQPCFTTSRKRAYQNNLATLRRARQRRSQSK